jgi:cytochrome d ubiquinol oxidase subunit II
MVSSTNTAYNLTVNNTASPPYTLKVMTVTAAILFPVVLAYQAWTYKVFRRRLSVPKTDADGRDSGSGSGSGDETVVTGEEAPDRGT